MACGSLGQRSPGVTAVPRGEALAERRPIVAFLARVFPRLPLAASGPSVLRYWGRPVGDEEDTAQETSTHFKHSIAAPSSGHFLASRNNESLAGIWLSSLSGCLPGPGPLYAAVNQPRAPAVSARPHRQIPTGAHVSPVMTTRRTGFSSAGMRSATSWAILACDDAITDRLGISSSQPEMQSAGPASPFGGQGEGLSLDVG